MLLALVFCHLSVLVAANPFHKYPFVFLLDVGNEELENTNSEQIRISVPGGSVALRYPAIGDGNTIGHVRVSGIDFGTDLKANIVDGGPGYKYVVLVFMGNPGVPYDAVVTVQTMVENGFNIQNTGTVVESVGNSYQSEEDANNSAEDLSDFEVSSDSQKDIYIQKNNAELMQSSSNVYSYAENESMDEDDASENDPDDERDVADSDNDVSSNEVDSEGLTNEETSDNDEYEGVVQQKDIHVPYNDDIEQEETVQVKNDEEDNDDDDISSNEEQSLPNNYSEEKPSIEDSNVDSHYESLKHNTDFGEYSQDEYQKNSRPAYQEDPLDYEESDAELSYDDEEVNGPDKFRDSNNNNYDDSYAVAY